MNSCKGTPFYAGWFCVVQKPLAKKEVVQDQDAVLRRKELFGQRDVIAVSYTHLDVYKRQIPMRSIT